MEDFLNFNPAQLNVFNAPKAESKGDSLVYRTRPADSKSEDGIYRSTIKIIYNPFDFPQSIVEQQSYWMQDAEGWFSMVSSLTVNDQNCPIFKAWKKCRYSEEGSVLNNQQKSKAEGGKGLFDKRFSRYVTIQVLEDENQPELVGKYLFWKLPKSIWDMINAKLNPTDPKKAQIPVMDFLFGRSIDLEVVPGPDDKNAPERKTRETKYMGEISEECVSVINVDGSPILNDEEQEVLDEYVSLMKKVWKTKDVNERNALNAEVNNSETAKALRKIYAKVLDQIKQVCPNVVEHLGYKEPDEKLRTRVENWINVVLSGNDPAKHNAEMAQVATTATVEPGTVKGSENSTAYVNDTTEEDDDDLPF